MYMLLFFSVPCDTLATVTGGNINLWSDGFITYANFTCSKGTSLSGERMIQCRNNGQWDFSVPTCGMFYRKIYISLIK